MADVDFNNTTPAAPGGNTNVTWQKTGNSISAYVSTAGGGTVTSSGTPTIHQLPVWTTATDLKGITGGGGTLLQGVASADPTFTISPTLGIAGSSVGTLEFANATSGTIKLSPTTGALISTVITLPAFTGTAVVAATDTTTTHALFATATAGAPAYRAIVQGDLPAQPYDLVCSLVGQPGAGAIVLIFTAVRTIIFPGDFSGSAGTVGTNPTSTAAYDIKNNGSTIGAVSISTGGAVTFTTVSGTSKTLVSGDRLTIIAPGSQDATLADVGFTLAGTR